MAIGQSPQNFFAIYSEVMPVYEMVDCAAKEVVQLVNGGGEHRIACHCGCNTCCTVFVRATFAESAAIVHWLFEWSNADRLNRFRSKFATWRAAAEPEVDMLEVLATRSHVRLDSGSESQLYAESVRTFHRRRLMCPFNADDGSCDIYPLRPIACRAFFVTDTSKGCSLDTNDEVGIVRHEKLSEIALLGKKSLSETSAAAGYGTISALPLGVHRALALLEAL